VSWRRWIPFGLAEPEKPRHYRDMALTVWENRGSLPYAWRILRDGVCDGCSLGPYGLRDNVIPGVHLCTTRLRLLRLNTMGALDPRRLADAEALERMGEEALRGLGRLPVPLVRARGERGFRATTWSEALGLLAARLRDVPGERMGFFATSRGLTNETYFTFQKAARLLGSSHVDLCARLCHAASVSGLAETLGTGAPTCSLSDLIGADLVVLLGTDLANNQPVTTKYLHYARERGTRILVVNPYREPGLERYWVPSVAKSALFGTPLMDDFFQVHVGGDVAFLSGAIKRLVELGAVERAWVDAHTRGFAELERQLAATPWRELEESSGLPFDQIDRFARQYAAAKSAVFVYSMGLTQHRFGVDNVKAVANLALARGMLGRPRCGILPIRGHSGVQGGGECGVDPHKLPGGAAVGSEGQARFEQEWGRALPRKPGLRVAQMVEAAARGEIELLYSLGGNLLDTLPDRDFVREALSRVAVRVHQDLVINPAALLPPADLVVLLPAQTRYEQRGGGTSTNTERRIRFSPEIAGHPQVGEALPEWDIPCRFARALRPELAPQLDYADAGSIRAEMARLMPQYAGVDRLREKGDWVQWGGPQLFRTGFPGMPDGRARFACVPLPETRIPEGRFYLSTRRGKQFNSMRYGERDPLTGGRRDDVFVSAADAERLGLADGAAIELRSETGRFVGRARIAPVKPRTLQAFWPEANVLIPRRCDPVSGEPDYNATVELVAL
jgi:molybdopterin-dependent oxidoreductase alpha subunit